MSLRTAFFSRRWSTAKCGNLLAAKEEISVGRWRYPSFAKSTPRDDTTIYHISEQTCQVLKT
jgi:hypothetical protein